MTFLLDINYFLLTFLLQTFLFKLSYKLFFTLTIKQATELQFLLLSFVFEYKVLL